MNLIEQVKDTLKWMRGTLPSSWEQAERRQRELRNGLEQARKRADALQLLVRGMRRKEDWGND